MVKALDLWEQTGLPEHASKEKFLWALHLLKCHNNERTSAAFCGGLDKGAFCHWAWCFIGMLSCLAPLVVSNDTAHSGQFSHTSESWIASCRMTHPTLFCTRRNSGLLVFDASLLCPCGSVPICQVSAMIHRSSKCVEQWMSWSRKKKAEADAGHLAEHPACCMCPGGHNPPDDQERMRGTVCMQHECINDWMKRAYFFF